MRFFRPARLFRPVLSAVLLGLLMMASLPATAQVFKVSTRLKLLVLTGTTADNNYQALSAFLDQLGVPSDTYVIASAADPMPPLRAQDGTALYNGIVLANGELYAGPGQAGMTPELWTALQTYSQQTGVRVLVYFTWPRAEYGMLPSGTSAGDSAIPSTLRLTSDGSKIFNYLKSSIQAPVTYAWSPLANLYAGAGESSRALATLNNTPVMVLHKKANGNEVLASSLNNNPYLIHSQLMNYGLINWVSRGLFLGSRKIYMSPQVDDIFLGNDLFDASNPACVPSAFMLDPAYDPAVYGCPVLRITDKDAKEVLDWQKNSRITVSMVYNGYGVDNPGVTPDRLTPYLSKEAKNFYWVNHTHTHEDLDCYDIEAGDTCPKPATFQQADLEIKQNIALAKKLKLPLDKVSMVTPALSGLNNQDFLAAAYQNEIRNLVSDAVKFLQAGRPNTGSWTDSSPSIFVVPRWATNIFYNTSTAQAGVPGSQIDEFNHFYASYFGKKVTYPEMLTHESNLILDHMLTYSAYGLMFHQANLKAYSGSKTLMTDLLQHTLDRYKAYSTLPVVSLQQYEIAQLLRERMAYNDSGVEAVVSPLGILTIRSPNAAVVPVTGVCSDRCGSYGEQKQSAISVPANGSRTTAVDQTVTMKMW
jgi:hypothetical protein